MLYALFLIIFFAIDILLVSKLKILGMLPIYYLLAGIGTSFFININHYKSELRYYLKTKSFFTFFLLYMIAITLFHFLIGFRALFGTAFIDSTTFLSLTYISNIVQIISSCFLIFAIFYKSLKNIITRWILYSAIMNIIYNMLDAFLSLLPTEIHRYSGIVGLLLAFGWLMIVFTLINQKYNVKTTGCPYITLC